MGTAAALWSAYRMRWKRRRLLFRAVRKRWQIKPLVKRTTAIRPDDILLFATIRNEADRLPFFLDHYRKLGVGHFLFVDNGSDDGTLALLRDQTDVSLWKSDHSYKLSRFGMDWLTLLLVRHGHGHWCLTVDADELLIYPDHETRPLPDLTAWLDAQGQRSFGALMLDLYPRGRVSAQTYAPGQDPTEILQWYDPEGYTTKYQADLDNLLIRGGVRGRKFFATEPERAPTLSKLPLVKWNRRFVYVSSTHSALPRRLNRVRGAGAETLPSGVLLHTKFLHTIIGKSREEKQRKEHFENSRLYEAYYDQLIADPDFHGVQSVRYVGWPGLAEAGLMRRGNW